MAFNNYIWYTAIIFILLVSCIVIAKKYSKQLTRHEGFTATTLSDKTGFEKSQPWPLTYDNGLKPLVLQNKNIWPVYKIGVLGSGSISHIVAQYLQRKIYPMNLVIQPSTVTILAGISDQPNSGKIFDFGFIREQLLLDLSRVESGIKSVSVLAPAYWETLYLIGNKHTIFNSLVDLKKPISTINDNLIRDPEKLATQKIGILRDSLLYWQAITKALDLKIGRDYIKVENDDLAQLLSALERREVDAVFMITHTYDSRLQAFLKTNETHMIGIYPTSKYPTDTDMNLRPYNPETTDLISKFKSDIKVYLPWIFEETVSLGKSTGLKKKLSTDTVLGMNNTSGSSIYRTFKVRSYLCSSRQLGRDTQIISKLGTAYLEEYQSLGLLINEWGRGNKSILTRESNIMQNKQLILPTLVFSDYDSFNPDMLGSIPTEIELNTIMRDLIAIIYKRIKIEKPILSCDI
jgi:hypothetical protein